MDSIPQTPLAELQRDGWPVPRVVGNYPQVTDLNQLIRYMRNAVAHCNLEFQADSSMEITAVQLWNVPPGRHVDWRAELSIDELHILVEKFLGMLLAQGGSLTRP